MGVKPCKLLRNDDTKSMKKRNEVGPRERNDICESFNRMVWHYSELRGIHIQHREDVDDVVLEIALREDASERPPIPIKLVLEDVAFVLCDLDLQFKRQCVDAISDATCKAESELKDRIEKERLKFSPNALKNYFHFRFYLVPPAGTLDVLAAGFVKDAN